MIRERTLIAEWSGRGMRVSRMAEDNKRIIVSQELAVIIPAIVRKGPKAMTGRRVYLSMDLEEAKDLIQKLQSAIARAEEIK